MGIKDDKARVVTILDKNVKNKLEELARIDKRSLSNYICKLLEEHVRNEYDK